MSLHRMPSLIAAVLVVLFAAPAGAQVVVTDSWVRGTVAGQQGTGAFMRLTSPADVTLVGVASPAAKVAEIHEMKVEGGMMKMSAVAKVAAPGGKGRRVEARRLSRDADGPRAAVEGRRHGAAVSDFRGQRRGEADDRSEGAGALFGKVGQLLFSVDIG